jgi:hypothetical protein
VAGWASAVAALAGGRDTSAGRIVVYAGLGALGYILIAAPMLVGRFLRGDSGETWHNFVSALLLALLLLSGSAVVGLWAIGAI